MYDTTNPKPVAFHALTGALSCYGIITTKAYLEKAIKKGMPVLKERTSATGRSIRTMSPEDCAEWIKEHWEMFPFNHFSLDLREQFAREKGMSEEDMLDKFKGLREKSGRPRKHHNAENKFSANEHMTIANNFPIRQPAPILEEDSEAEWYSDIDAREYGDAIEEENPAETQEDSKPLLTKPISEKSPWSPLNALLKPSATAPEKEKTPEEKASAEWTILPRQMKVAKTVDVAEDYRIKVGDEIEICKWNGRLMLVPERYLGQRGTVICAENDMGQLQVRLHDVHDIKSIHVSVCNVKLVQCVEDAVQYRIRKMDNGDVLIVLRNGERSYALCKFRPIPELSISSEDVRIMAESVVSDFL